MQGRAVKIADSRAPRRRQEPSASCLAATLACALGGCHLSRDDRLDRLRLEPGRE